MIASLKGIIEQVSPDSAVINVGGVGFQIYAPTSTLSTLGMPGSEARVFTHTHVREDAILLYGFAAQDELKLFQMLINVSGLGPKVALSLLSSLSVEQIISAIAGGSEALLTSAPGVGKKLAGRLILELKDKIAGSWIGTQIAAMGEGNEDVVSALLSLGYTASEASRAVASLPRKNDLTLEDKIKLALGWFNSR
jgi:Holliday junction DNA helicase RuvA